MTDETHGSDLEDDMSDQLAGKAKAHGFFILSHDVPMKCLAYL